MLQFVCSTSIPFDGEIGLLPVALLERLQEVNAIGFGLFGVLLKHLEHCFRGGVLSASSLMPSSSRRSFRFLSPVLP